MTAVCYYYMYCLGWFTVALWLAALTVTADSIHRNSPGFKPRIPPHIVVSSVEYSTKKYAQQAVFTGKRYYCSMHCQLNLHKETSKREFDKTFLLYIYRDLFTDGLHCLPVCSSIHPTSLWFDARS